MIGQTFGQYRIETALGAGGMGVVYRAFDTELQRPVAIKVLGEGADDETTHQRLLREARAASALNHPNICAVHEVRQASGKTFIVMEYVEGRSLGDLIPAGGLPVESVVRYGLQIADALATAHEKGIVHRDLKSSNIVITPEGRVKVLDFGLALRLPSSEQADITRSQERGVSGTLAYMAPEVLSGKTADLRSDIWALGVVLYEMAAGRLPFRGQTGFEVSGSILYERPSALPSRVPAALAAIIQRCLAKDPAQRYQRASETRAALEATQSDSTSTGPASAKRSVRWAVAISAGALSVLLALALVSIGRDRLPSRPAVAQIGSIAVLPLENLSRDIDQEYFADGMTDALISNLGQFRALRVISRTSVMRYKQGRKPLPEIARELGVDSVVEGSVLRSGDRVRITARLIHAGTDTPLWSQQYERDLRDVLALQSELARAIAGEIQVKLTPQERAQLGAVPQVRPDAYEAYLKGRHHWYRRSPDALKRSLEYFRQAIAADPGFALAYAGVADSYNSLGWDLFAVVPPMQAFPRAREAARKALELDPRTAEAHAALGWAAFTYDWDWTVAEREFRTALELNPRYAPAHIWYAHFLKAMGRTDESIAEGKRALESDPLGLIINLHMGWHYLFVRQYDRAIEQLRQTIDLDPNFLLAHMFLGEAYEQKGMFDASLAEFQKTVDLSGRHPLYVAALGHGYAVAGQREQALKVIDDLKRLSSHTYVPARGIAEIYIGLGDRDRAFAWLEKAVNERNGWLVHLASNPRYDPLRSDPRFQTILRRIGLPH